MKRITEFTRRKFLEIGSLGAIGLMLAPNTFSQSKSESENMLLYVGTYTEKGSEGIYVFKFDVKTGALSKLHTVKDVVQPSYLAVTKSRKYLFAVNELLEYEGKKSGCVSAFAIDQMTGNLTFLNKQPSLGGAPCHISISDNEKFVLVANYLGGNISVYPIAADGKLGESTDLDQHTGTGPRTERQESAHAHSITLDNSNRFAVACDLGADKVFNYKFDDKTGSLELNPAQNFYQPKAGSGPRHFAFHQNGKFAFLINELECTISSLAFDSGSGVLKEIQTVSTLPKDFKLPNTCADIHISPNGKFVYATNRGHDSLVVYKIDQKTGQLKFVQHQSTGGKTPRNFTISPNGKFLLAANQNSDSINVFKINEKSGKLTATANSAIVSMPVCLKFMTAF